MRKNSFNPMMRLKWLFWGIGLVILLIIYHFFMGFFFYEGQDYVVMDRVRELDQKLFSYKQTNSRLPDSLRDIGESEEVCINIKCFTIGYKVSADKQNFAMASFLPTGLIIHQMPDLKKSNSNGFNYTCRTGLAYPDDSIVKDGSWPIYKQDKECFSDPSVWPDLKEPPFWVFWI